MNLIAISDARSSLPKLINRVSKKLERFLITVNNQPKAVLIGLDELESLEETAEVLSVKPNIEKLLKKTKSQKTISLSNLQKKYKLSQ